MSSYFNEMSGYVADDFRDIEQVECKVIKDVTMVTGDKEFPDDLRESIQAIIAIHSYSRPEGKRMSDCGRRSVLIDELHSAFHEIAGRKIKTRFGLLSDNPKRILAARHECVKKKFGQ